MSDSTGTGPHAGKAVDGPEDVVDVREAVPDGPGQEKHADADITEGEGVIDGPEDGPEEGSGGGVLDGPEAPTLSAAVEAILLVVDEPVSARTLAQVLQRPTREVEATLETLAADYASAGRGFELRAVAGGWRFYTHPSCAGVVEQFVVDGQQARLTQAALETLAVIAYRQPVSRSRVSAVRGVNVDGVIRTLVGRGLIEECGTEQESGALLYRTTSHFLERLGLGSIDELPELAPMLPEIETLEPLDHSI